LSAQSLTRARNLLQAPASASPGMMGPALVVAVVAVVYFGLFNHDFSVNGLRYADDVERGIELFHPNHLLPNVLFRGIYRLAQDAGLAGVRAIWLMQAITVCFGIVTAAAIARIGQWRADAAGGFLAGTLYAFGFAAWNFAEEPDVYVLPAAAVAVSLAFLLPRARLSWRAVVMLAVLAVFAVLTLQQYVFWYPALLALVAQRDLGAARRGKVALLAAGVPLACLAVYLAIGWSQQRLHSLDDALGWFLGYAWNGAYGFGTFRPAPEPGARLLGTLLGFGNLVFAYEIVLSRVAIAVALAALLPLAMIFRRSVAFLRREPAPLRRDAFILIAWSAANVLFATWWESRNIEFLFPAWVGLCALLALATPAVDRRLLALTVAMVAGVNLAVAFWPQHDWPVRYRLVQPLARTEHLAPGDVLITEELNTVGYLHYFDGVDVRFLPGAVSAAMQAAEPVAKARRAVDAALASGARIYTTEFDERGRLREIARWFAPLGRSDFDGAIDRDMEVFYHGLDVATQPVPGVRRVRAATSAH
jgi:hypothetical protein